MLLIGQPSKEEQQLSGQFQGNLVFFFPLPLSLTLEFCTLVVVRRKDSHWRAQNEFGIDDS